MKKAEGTFVTYVKNRRVEVLRNIAEIMGDGESILHQAAEHLIKAGGKLVRPSFVLLACEAVNGDPEKAIPVAAATELGHAGSLIHDDIIDEDEMRRGVPAVHAKFGVPLAILAGDMLIFKSFHSLTRTANTLGHDRVVKILDVLCRAAITMNEGESTDIEFMNRYDVTENDYFNMIKKKTAEAFRAALEVGAIAGGGTKEEVEALSEYGLLFGTAFQIRDDLIGISSDEAETGKPASDILKGRRTLVVIRALRMGKDEDKTKLLRIFQGKNASKEEVREVINILMKYGSIDYAEAKIIELIEKAKSRLSLLKDTPTKKLLLELADFVAKGMLTL